MNASRATSSDSEGMLENAQTQIMLNQNIPFTAASEQHADSDCYTGDGTSSH